MKYSQDLTGQWLTCGALPRHYLLIVSSIATACPSPICRACGEKCRLNAVEVCLKRMGRMSLLPKFARQEACTMSGISPSRQVQDDKNCEPQLQNAAAPTACLTCHLEKEFLNTQDRAQTEPYRVKKKERRLQDQASNAQDLLHLQGQGCNSVPTFHVFFFVN